MIEKIDIPDFPRKGMTMSVEETQVYETDYPNFTFYLETQNRLIAKNTKNIYFYSLNETLCNILKEDIMFEYINSKNPELDGTKALLIDVIENEYEPSKKLLSKQFEKDI